MIRFLLGLMRRGAQMGAHGEPARANERPALRLLSPSGELVGVMTVDVVDGVVCSVLNQINPDKLGHLGPVGDIGALLRGET